MTKYETEHYEVVLLGPERGYFEHSELGGECGGGLWMDQGELIDYDGVYMLPAEVLEVLERAGVNCDEIRKSLED